MSVAVDPQPRRASGSRSPLARALHRLGAALEQAAADRERRHLIAESKRELRALDDRTLRDIGVPRHCIDEVVAGVARPQEIGR